MMMSVLILDVPMSGEHITRVTDVLTTGIWAMVKVGVKVIQVWTMATITIDTDKLDADLDYYDNGWFGISIYYKGELIKKIEK